jgi:hypothetical protein
MIKEFEPVVNDLSMLVENWEAVFSEFPFEVITQRRNGQGRAIKQIVGHMIDSARIIPTGSFICSIN